MDVGALLISMGSMGGLGAIFSIGLAIANKKLHVDVDPRIAKILDTLPGANCGGCGYPGCAAFSENVVTGTAQINDCPVNTSDGVEEMAEIMGIEAIAAEKKVARVLCKGGYNETARKGNYLGVQTCVAAHLHSGGDKLCEFGCMGHGDCVLSCPFDAILINKNGIAEVIDEKCTGCANCVMACPRDIIEVHPESLNLFIFCKSRDEAKYAKTVCTVACTGCGICAKKAEEGHITMENNLPIIDHSFGPVQEIPTLKCPTNALTLLDEDESEDE